MFGIRSETLEGTMHPAQRLYPANTQSSLFPFVLRRDDFSVQLSNANDALFWLRIQTQGGQADDPSVLIISDFKRSKLRDEDLINALELGIELARNGQGFDRVVFLDIAPSAGSDQESVAQRESTEIKKLLVRTFNARNLAVKTAEVKRKKGKFDLEFSVGF
jgi:hypothetical protein